MMVTNYHIPAFESTCKPSQARALEISIPYLNKQHSIYLLTRICTVNSPDQNHPTVDEAAIPRAAPVLQLRNLRSIKRE